MQLALSEVDLAQELGLSLAAYGDLEQHHDELATCVTLGQARQLAARLGIPLLELLSEGTPSPQMPSPCEVAERVSAHMASVGVSVESFEEHVGWNLKPFLEEPSLVAPLQPILFFQEVAKAMHAAPLSLVPHVA